MTYDEARPWAKAIRDEVLERRMPPWGAVEGIRAYRNDPSLTPIEVEMIVSWVEGGAPEGEVIYLPVAPVLRDATPPPMPAPTLVVESAKPLVLKHAITAVAVTPRDLPDGASMEVTAYEPEGSVEHLIWLRNYRKAWTRTYGFRDPISLPAGTRIVVDGPQGTAAMLSISPS